MTPLLPLLAVVPMLAGNSPVNNVGLVVFLILVILLILGAVIFFIRRRE